ncbi:MAG: hypothetical protein F6J92_30175 [Symploca sp. SIO1A3]|nr:hypothetical protein [Symploca sp. SIO1A3]
MIAQSKPPVMSPTEYLQWEENQPIKYEYINGKVYAMTGGTITPMFSLEHRFSIPIYTKMHISG